MIYAASTDKIQPQHDHQDLSTKKLPYKTREDSWMHQAGMHGRA